MLWALWNKQMKIPKSQYTISGFSIAALRTGFYIKELNIMLDAGLHANFVPEVILVTHQHLDHCVNLPSLLYSNKTNIKIFLPKESSDKVIDYIGSCFNMTSNTNNYDKTQSDITNVIPNTIYKLHNNIVIEIIKCDHTVPTVGYGIIQRKKKLKKEYIGLTGKELKQLKLDNTVIDEEIDSPFLCYLGDTSKEVFSEKEIEKYPVIMIECTFILDDEIKRADETKHMHWNYLKDYVNKHPDITFILYHFSSRYKPSVIDDFFKKLDIKNVIPWISE